MNIVKRQAFLTLPEGTIFQFKTGGARILTGVFVKMDTIKDGDRNIDFRYSPLFYYYCDIEGEVCPPYSTSFRDGLFDDEAEYIVFDNDDISRLGEFFK